jgi:hypothetical protein
MGCDEDTRCCIRFLKRTHICEINLAGFDLIIYRTGYTGEKFSYEIFVHPARADELFNAILEAGQQYGIKPCELGARDSLRTEAGLPLYAHEMGGELNMGVAEAGFGQYIKTYQPWFIGRQAFLEKEKSDSLISEASKTIFSYCRARTSSKEEAEDLSQDIILELMKTRMSLRDDKAFYGFMWAVAGNVYKSWCKKRVKVNAAELDDNVSDNSIPLAELLEKESDIRLLYR